MLVCWFSFCCSVTPDFEGGPCEADGPFDLPYRDAELGDVVCACSICRILSRIEPDATLGALDEAERGLIPLTFVVLRAVGPEAERGFAREGLALAIAEFFGSTPLTLRGIRLCGEVILVS